MPSTVYDFCLGLPGDHGDSSGVAEAACTAFLLSAAWTPQLG